MTLPEIETERLLLRQFRPSDLDPLCSLYSDPEVMKYVGKGVRTRAETAASLPRFLKGWQQSGFGMWAFVDKQSQDFVGRGGLFLLDTTSEVEIGYALAKKYWGKGLATEAARACLWFGFETVKLDRVVAIARPENLASQRVMQKLGMIYEKNAFFYNSAVVYYAIAHTNYHPDAAFHILKN